jgi:hypothetical protein
MVSRFGLLLVPGLLAAQSSNGYFAAGLGSYVGKLTSQYVMGGEWVGSKRIGVGGELGVLAGHNSFGFVSANGSYHFNVPGGSKVHPFVTGGLGTTLNLVGSGELLANVGGGVNYWFLRRLGLRVELRDMIGAGSSTAASHVWGFRVGVALH